MPRRYQFSVIMCRGKGKVLRGLTHTCSPRHGLASGHILYIATAISVRPSAATTIQQGHTVNFGGQLHPPSHQNRNFCSASPLTAVQMNGAISGAERISMMCLPFLCNMCRYTNRHSGSKPLGYLGCSLGPTNFRGPGFVGAKIMVS